MKGCPIKTMKLCPLAAVILIIMCAPKAKASADNSHAKPVYAQVSSVEALLKSVAEANEKGGTIILEPGTYTITEPIVIRRSDVCLAGSGWNTVIKRKGDGDALVFQGSLWNCSVRNLAITGDSNAKTGSGIVFKDGEWSGIAYIDYCRIMNFAESGIRFEGNPKAPFSSNTVSNCWLVGNLGHQLYSRYNNDFYITGNQFGMQPNRVPRTGAYLDHSSAGTYTKNYHWGNQVALRIIGSHFNRIENNRLEQSLESGIVIGDPKSDEWSQLNIFLGNTIHTNSETNSGKFSAVVAYKAVDTTFCSNQIFSWDSNSTKMKSGLVLGQGCRNWIVKDNIIRHCVETPIVYDRKVGHIVKDNILDTQK
ncbi:MAG: right-handed parallel beta-helix repeat-containing protein [Armatimonadetes bacterium]|nr:right-handed parallel beta-helix repeat-containing protein [Armatimonadota bacterium]